MIVEALDGYPIATRRYETDGARARIVVAGATGVPQGFYRSFAAHAAARGFDAITFDYRGVGDSAPDTLRGFRMDYRDWARLDMASVLHSASGDLLLHLVSHSYGGHALGLLPDPSIVMTMHAYGTGSGWKGWMPRSERLRVAFLWNVFGPTIVSTRGYLAWKRFGLGEDLPVDVYRQWKRWCRYPGYWFDDPEIGAEMRALFARVTVPITAINAVDDRWSSPAARDAFFRHYVNADLTVRDLQPAELGQSSIGHMGYFRRGSEPLWDELLDELTLLQGR
ncbi:MAG: alpha/beta fold hydrolase [Actinomycetota bacterium]